MSTTKPTRDRELEAFLALLAARCSPRTVDAYRRDLGRLSAFLGKRLAGATLEELERYTAELRAAAVRRAIVEAARPSARSSAV